MTKTVTLTKEQLLALIPSDPAADTDMLSDTIKAFNDGERNAINEMRAAIDQLFSEDRDQADDWIAEQCGHEEWERFKGWCADNLYSIKHAGMAWSAWKFRAGLSSFPKHEAIANATTVDNLFSAIGEQYDDSLSPADNVRRLIQRQAAGVPDDEFPHDEMDAIALRRFKVEQTDSNIWGWCVRAGDGTQELYKGRKSDCEAVARRLVGAFLDGAMLVHDMLAAVPQPQQPKKIEVEIRHGCSQHGQQLRDCSQRIRNQRAEINRLLGKDGAQMAIEPIAVVQDGRYVHEDGVVKQTIRILFNPLPEGAELYWGRPQQAAIMPKKLAIETDSLEIMKSLAREIGGLIAESEGVYGLHLNGDPSPWEELLPGGRFERLTSLEKAFSFLGDEPKKEDAVVIDDHLSTLHAIQRSIDKKNNADNKSGDKLVTYHYCAIWQQLPGCVGYSGGILKSNGVIECYDTIQRIVFDGIGQDEMPPDSYKKIIITALSRLS